MIVHRDGKVINLGRMNSWEVKGYQKRNGSWCVYLVGRTVGAEYSLTLETMESQEAATRYTERVGREILYAIDNGMKVLGL